MKWRIYAPNKKYNGVSASVRFVSGVGETDNEKLLDWFRQKGYTVKKSTDKLPKGYSGGDSDDNGNDGNDGGGGDGK